MTTIGNKLTRIIYNPPIPFRSPVKIVMFHTGRCGSTVLANLISQNRYIFWDAELFEKIEKNIIYKIYMTTDPMKILRMRMIHARRFYGFETKLQEKQEYEFSQINMDLKSYLRQLSRMGFDRFIILDRKNYLRQIVSGAIGFKTMKWHQPLNKIPVLTKIKIDPNYVPFGNSYKPLLNRFEEFNRTYSTLEKLLKPYNPLKLSYEDDILENPLHGYRRLCMFLDLPSENVSVKLGKMNPFPLSEIVENFQNIIDTLSGTPYEWMLKY